ncbi:MAG: discoidin domain-containing protein [Anaerolineales bacterium]|nr:discoidin domain-containing protein [Anaerolineales bacterium]
MKKVFPFLLVPIFLLLACNLSSTPTPAVAPPAETQTATPVLNITIAPTLTPTTYVPPEHHIGTRVVDGVGEFYDRQSGERFVPRGVNYFYIIPAAGGFQDRFFGVDVYDHERVAADFQQLSELGYNTVRIFLDTCNGGTGCIGNPSGRGLNPEYLDNIVDTMQLAKQHGLYLLLTSNDLPDQGGYWDLSNQGSNENFEGYRNAHYLTLKGVQSAQLYWGDLMQGLTERHAPFDALLGWSLLNEQWFFNDTPPFSLNTGRVTTANGNSYDLSDPEQKRAMAIEGITYYIEVVRETILAADPTALITMGFFHPDYPNPTRIGDFRYVETAPLLGSTPLDFYDFHAYPGVELDMESYVENFGMLGYDEKPIIMGEIGAFLDSYPTIETAAPAIQNWIAASCEYGYDGWLYWGLYRAPEAIGDATWGFKDAENTMMNALAPSNQPDACVTTDLTISNLAYGKAATASNALDIEPPENAVDGSSFQWGSGGDAPQWIEIDLGEPATVEEIRLLVGQWPPGETVHQVWVGPSNADLRQVHEFRQSTDEGDLLTLTPDSPLTDIQIIRIVTVSSPSWVSWKEIEVIGSFP